jgi:hypothetical protein
MCGIELDSVLGSGKKNVMKTRHFVLCFTIGFTGCTGHQTFDDGSDAVREHREDAGPRSDGAKPAGNTASNGSNVADAGGNAASAGSNEADAGAANPTLGADTASNGSDIADGGGNAASAGSNEADAGAANSTLEVGADVEGTTVMVDVGEELILTLQTIGPGNYEEAMVMGDALESLGSEYATLQNPGGPTQLFHFRGVAPGQATVSIPHTTRPTFAFQIAVQ